MRPFGSKTRLTARPLRPRTAFAARSFVAELLTARPLGSKTRLRCKTRKVLTLTLNLTLLTLRVSPLSVGGCGRRLVLSEAEARGRPRATGGCFKQRDKKSPHSHSQPHTSSMTHLLRLIPLLFLLLTACGTPAENQQNPLGQKAEDGPPQQNRLVKQVLDEVFDEPMEMALLPNGDILLVERKGAIKRFDKVTRQTVVVAELNVHQTNEDGLLGLALDPDYLHNHWIYLFYSPPGFLPLQYVSRFEYWNDEVKLSSEKVILEITVQRDECCHSAGSLEFGPKGNLFISVGDNTNPFESGGYAPIDERRGRKAFDARRSSSNTQDLRGKILRIHPEPDGSYTIPDGNLFPKDGTQGRPEIYVMGCRNPFRYAIDKERYFLYWGDVGPDAAYDSLGRGPKGHDELNLAMSPGYYGWPLFNGNNKPYNAFDFTTKVSSDLFDPKAPLNTSRNNAGIQELPPARSALIWYPYDISVEFPMTKSGSRNAMAGPTYYAAGFEGSPVALPAYYNGKTIFFDWMRGWMFMLSVSDSGKLEHIEPFAPHLKFNNPIDMELAPDGSLYVLEYGTGWFLENPDARISRIIYERGNRAPLPKITTDRTNGAAPLTVSFSASESVDLDGDSLTYSWWVGNAHYFPDKKGLTLTHTFETPGSYDVRLRAADDQGKKMDTHIEIVVGNEAPTLDWQLTDRKGNAVNKSFYWARQWIAYQVMVSDLEDGTLAEGIDAQDVAVSIDYLKEGMDPAEISLGHQSQAAVVTAEALLEANNCIACHKLDQALVGPAYGEVADAYRNRTDAIDYLVGKILKGGTGVWGDHVMAAQPQLSATEATKIARFIMSLGQGPAEVQGLPVDGTFTTVSNAKKGAYYLQATYTDRGAAGVPALKGQANLLLRAPCVEVETIELGPGVLPIELGQGPFVDNLVDSAYLVFRHIDMTGLGRVVFQFANVTGGRVELRLDGLGGPLVSETALVKDQLIYEASLKPANDFHDLFVVFRNEQVPGMSMAGLDRMCFRRE